ncbi:unnamed protein product [Amoebophrya sp. A25]|nr:unnamed protein product [Amoebophrya sp. A25]|eukprot:GSA25T00003125001.1
MVSSQLTTVCALTLCVIVTLLCILFSLVRSRTGRGGCILGRMFRSNGFGGRSFMHMTPSRQDTFDLGATAVEELESDDEGGEVRRAHGSCCSRPNHGCCSRIGDEDFSLGSPMRCGDPLTSRSGEAIEVVTRSSSSTTTCCTTSSSAASYYMAGNRSPGLASTDPELGMMAATAMGGGELLFTRTSTTTTTTSRRELMFRSTRGGASTRTSTSTRGQGQPSSGTNSSWWMKNPLSHFRLKGMNKVGVEEETPLIPDEVDQLSSSI